MYIFLTQCFPSRIGGIESLISNLALNIGNLNKVAVFADQHHFFFDSIYDNKFKDKILVRRYRGIKFFRQRKKVKELKIFAENNNINAVIADTWKSLELCIDYLKNKKIKVYCLAHGNELLTEEPNKKKRIIKTLNKVNKIIPNSNFTAELVYNLIGSRKNIQVIYPGAENLKDIKSESNLLINGSPVLLTLARLDKRKGHEEILYAVKRLKKDFPDIKYIIAGDGNQKKRLKKIVNEFNLNNCVNFVGKVNEGQKKQIFKKTDIMVMPTKDQRFDGSIEGFGLSYIEAAFFSIPSIATNVGGVPEAVLNNETGLILSKDDELYNALYKLLQNKEYCKKLGNNAKQRAEKLFKWEHVVKNYLSVFQN